MNKRKAFIPITALMAALLLALVAAMTPFVAGPNIAHAQSADATLSGLAIVGEPNDVAANLTVKDGTGGFSSSETEYTARIPFITAGVTVTATANDTNATVSFNYPDVNSTEDGHQINLSSRAGMTTDIEVTVRAEAGNTQKYTISVYRENQDKSKNANLASLSLGEVSIGGFSPGTTSYKARYKGETVTLSYGLSDTNGGASAAVTVADNDSGSSYDADTKKVTLANESYTTTITVTVTPEAGAATVSTSDDCTGTTPDANIKCYTIEVYRIRDNASPDATLQTLTLAVSSGGAFVAGNGIDLSANDFTAVVTNATEHVVITATENDRGADAVITPSDADENTTDHEIELTAGAIRTITVMVTAEDTNSKKEYTLKVYRQRTTLKTDADLSDLNVSKGSLATPFSKDTTAYNVRGLGPADTGLTITATPNDVGASVAFETNTGGTAAVDGSGKVTLAVAGTPTVVTVTVTPESGASGNKVYTVTIVRPRALPSADTSLLAVSITPVGGAISGGNDIVLADEDFEARVTSATTHVTVSATANASANGATAEYPAGQIPLTAGKTTEITVTVVAEDGTNKKPYVIKVYRERSKQLTDATLSALSLSVGTLSPAFSSDRMEYTARVENDVDEVKVEYTLNDNEGGASVAVDNAALTISASQGCNTDEGKTVSLGLRGTTTTISLCVTPEAGAGTENADLKVYEIKVFRKNKNPLPNAELGSLAITDVNPADSSNILTANADLTTQDPKLYVGYRVRTVKVVATPEDNSGGAIATIVSPPDKDATTSDHEIDLTAGAEATITVEVMAEDTDVDAKTRMVKVYRQSLTESTDATLSSLVLTGVQLTDADGNAVEFNPATATYKGKAAFSTKQTTVTAMTNHIGAGLELPTDADAKTPGTQVALTNAGVEYIIRIEVTPESAMAEANTGEVTIPSADTGKTIYTIRVTRAAEASTDATLSSLSVMDGSNAVALTPAFDADTTSYTADVGSEVESVNVSAMKTHIGATVSGDTGDQSLGAGGTTTSIVVKVTAEAGPATEDTADDCMGETPDANIMCYTVNVEREEDSPAAQMLRRYDTDRDGGIDDTEFDNAIVDWSTGEITDAEFDEVIVIWSNS